MKYIKGIRKTEIKRMSRILHEYQIEIAHSYQHQTKNVKVRESPYRTIWLTRWMFKAMEP